MFVPGKPFQSSLKILGKAGAYPSEAPFTIHMYVTTQRWYMRAPNLLGLTLKHSELEISSDITAQLVFCEQVLPPGVNVIKLLW